MRFGNPSKKDRTLASTKGHSIEFPGKQTLKDGKAPAGHKLPEGAVLNADGITFVFVPAVMHAECVQAGLLPDEEMGEAAEPAKPLKPEDPKKLQDETFEAFKVLKELNVREDFSGNGMPKNSALEKLMGYPITTNELKDLWLKFNTADKE